ncbi:MAG: hypothetical protein V7L14_13545 [Nostoc sp.]|uniref:hypothetical protein n=1 Tax=Nostoc sp. TaxID=1180 RepID=UPI002FFAB214
MKSTPQSYWQQWYWQLAWAGACKVKFPFTEVVCGSDRTITPKCNGLQRIMRTTKPLRNIEGH